MINKKIFIAGHKGMVGSCLLNFLKIEKKFKNIIVSDRKKLNLTDSKKVELFIKKNKPDVIINCAGLVGGIMANSNYPVQFLAENIKMQFNLIESAVNYNVKDIIFLGSSCIYPKFAKQPIVEDSLLSGKLEKTNEAYALAKIVGLKYLEYYNKQYKKNFITIMPCNLYGNNDNFDIKNSHFIPSLIRKLYLSKIDKTNKIEIWGSGNAKREMMHVSDLVRAIYIILKNLNSKNKTFYKAISNHSYINVGVGIDYPISYYVSLLKDIINPNCKVIYNKNYPDGTPRKLLNSKIMKSFNWKAEKKLKDGLKETYKWFLNNSKYLDQYKVNI
jgi:GDP-L-fucose synthase